jgi:uncharacterized protein RhaS with RHS repeats
MRQLENVVANHPSGFFALAAAPRQPLDAMPTSPRKTRVGGFRRHASGQTSSRGLCRSINTPGSRACGYKTMSGRHEWLNRDPIQEAGGLNLYAYVGNNPVNKIDPFGLTDVPTPDEIAALKGQLQAAELTVSELASRIPDEQANLKAAGQLLNQDPSCRQSAIIWESARDGLINAQNALEAAQNNARDLAAKYSAALAAASAAATGLYATATTVFTAPTVGASFTGYGLTGGAIAGGAVVGAAAVGAGIGYGASQLPVVGGGTVADFYGDVLYNAFPSCFR